MADLVFLLAACLAVAFAGMVGVWDGRSGAFWGIMYVPIAPFVAVILLHLVGPLVGHGGPDGYGIILFVLVGWVAALAVWAFARAASAAR
jgi:hypothetical protein